MKIVKNATFICVGLAFVFLFTAFSNHTDVFIDSKNLIEIDLEDSLLSALKYDKIETCPYFMYDEDTGQHINDDPLPVASVAKAKELLNKLSTMDGSYLGLEPPNKKSVQFTWEEEDLVMSILNVNPDGYYGKVMTIEEAYEVIDIVFEGKDFSSIKDIEYDSWL
jgi:hypothetical protein